MIHALGAIYREHGIMGLWRGSSAAVARVSVGSAAQLSTFSTTKEMVIDLQVRMVACMLRSMNWLLWDPDADLHVHLGDLEHFL